MAVHGNSEWGMLRAGVSLVALACAAAIPATASAQQNPAPDAVPAQAGASGQPDATTQADAVQTADTPAPVDAADTAEPDIVVSGLRQSLQSAQAIKRNSDQFVDSVTAQDIGRLPDVNVAEALQRISGVQITRTYGEGTGVAVRGLTQVRTELNGRDVFSASGGRGLSFEEVGSDLLAGVDVYKNPSADLIEGGLSGLINLRTRLPFDAAGQVVSASVGSTYYDLAEKGGQQVSGLYSNRWKTGIGEIGILANASYQTTSFREDKVVVEPFYQHGPNPTNAPGIQTPIPGFENEQVLAPHGGGFRIGYGDRERTSYYGAVQWKPADTLEFYGQFFRADYDFRDQGVSFFAYGADMPPAAGRTTVVKDGLAQSGYFSNPNADSVIFSTSRQTSTTDISGGAKWDLTSRLRLSVDYQHISSRVEVQTINLTATALNPRTSVAGLGQSYDFFYDISGDLPVFQSTVPGYYANPANYGMTAILPYAEDNDATSDAIRADLNWDFDEGSLLRNIKVGGRYSDKSAINRNTTYGTWTAIGSSCANWSSDASCYTFGEFPQYAEANPYQSDLFRGAAGQSAFGPVQQFATALARDPQAAFAAVRAISGQEIGFRPFDANDAFAGTIDEKTYAAYARLGFGGEVAGLRFDGNLGLRWVRTESEAQGFRVLTYRDPNTPVVIDPATGTVVAPPNIVVKEPYGGAQRYDKYLPSVNTRVYFTERLLARFAYSKNFSRPDFTQLNPSFTLSPSYTDNASRSPDRLNPGQPAGPGNPYVGTGTVAGNPDLKPQEVENFDLALEWYFDNVGFIYGTVFKKNVKNIVDNRPVTLTQDVTGIGPVQFNVTTLTNIDKGFVKGFEIGGQKFLDFLPAPFDGLGVQANYTYVDSDAGISAAGDINSTTQIRVPLVGLSKDSYNAVLLYDKYGLNMRVAYNWRGNYLQGNANTGTQNLPIFGAAYGILDASITYDVTKNFAITIDGQNLLDSEMNTYQVFENRPRDYVIADRRFSIRGRIRF